MKGFAGGKVLTLGIQRDMNTSQTLLVCCSILGSYLGSLLGGSGVAAEQLFSGVLLGSSACYGLAMTLSTPSVCFGLGCCIQGLWGLYFPLMGQYRGRLVPHEHRACTLLLPKLAATLLSTLLLSWTAHSPLLFMAACAALTGGAGYIQHSLVSRQRGGVCVCQDYCVYIYIYITCVCSITLAN
ncbi:hypothetical protein EON64_05445 [archaeon]|nr:MAG: hypothetical protein EON64_05445 [archaeon]